MHYPIFVLLTAPLLAPAIIVAQPAPPPPSSLGCEEIERFLRVAKMGAVKKIPLGTTHPQRVALHDGRLQHEAEIQTVHDTKGSFQAKDWWEFNVAAYELAKMLELNMIPPYVERKVADRPASLSWWINDSMMEIERVQKKLDPPDADNWQKEVWVTQVFHQLVANASDHLSNFLIDRNWRLWMIDFTQAFGQTRGIPNKKALVRCDRKLLANMRKLDQETLTRRLGQYLTAKEINALLARRDKIVGFFDEQIAKKSEGAVLFDVSRVGQRCGAGL